MRIGAVILTMGNRPAELVELLESVAEQNGDPIDVVVVGNGIKASELPGLEKVRTLDLPENLGIPGGRNRGFEALLALPAERRPEAILVLDDDGKLDGPDSAEHIRAAFAANPRLGIVSFRICDPVSHEVQRRHVPRVRVGDPNHSSQVTTFLGGASAIRSAVDGPGRRAAGRLVLLPRGDRPGLARARRRLDHRVPLRRDPAAPEDHAEQARDVQLQRGTQPGLARPA